MRKYRDMTCQEFTASMPKLVASGKDIFAHPHVKRCRVHRALLEDLESIARAAQQLCPDVDPSDKVWEKIKDEIAPVDGLDERVSDPFPGYRLVSRTRVMHNWNPWDNPEAYDDHKGERNLSVPGTRIRVDGHKTPPHLEEGRR